MREMVTVTFCSVLEARKEVAAQLARPASQPHEEREEVELIDEQMAEFTAAKACTLCQVILASKVSLIITFDEPITRVLQAELLHHVNGRKHIKALNSLDALLKGTPAASAFIVEAGTLKARFCDVNTRKHTKILRIQIVDRLRGTCCCGRRPV